MTGARSGPVVVGSVYVHAPFCARRCQYCDFAVTVEKRPDERAWLRAIGAELTRVYEALRKDRQRLGQIRRT